MTGRRAIIPCWSCSAPVELNASICAKCGEQLPARGTLGGKVGMAWKTVVRLSEQLGADKGILETTARQYNLTLDELTQVIEIMKTRLGAAS